MHIMYVLHCKFISMNTITLSSIPVITITKHVSTLKQQHWCRNFHPHENMSRIPCCLVVFSLWILPHTLVVNWDAVTVPVVHGEVYGHGHRGHLVEGRKVTYVLQFQPLALTVRVPLNGVGNLNWNLWHQPWITTTGLVKHSRNSSVL